MPELQPAPSTLYRQVSIAAWDCVSVAGDAEASWRAVRDGRSALMLVDGRWRGRLDMASAVPDDQLRLLAISAARRPWTAIAGGRGPVAWSASTSKGDPLALDAALAGDSRRFIDSLPGMPGQRLARDLGVDPRNDPLLPCPVAAACSTGLYALLAAADLMESGRCARGLAGAADSSLTPLLLAGFDALGVATGARRPLAFVDDGATPTGFAPSEGAGFVAMAHAGPWRLVAGVRLSDATHETHFGDPRTLAGCLAALWRHAPEPELIITHGTGTAAGDAYERAGLDAGPWRGARRIHCKPIIGHSLGASGAVELALGLSSSATTLWKISLGFGGHLAAVAVQRISE